MPHNGLTIEQFLRYGRQAFAHNRGFSIPVEVATKGMARALAELGQRAARAGYGKRREGNGEPGDMEVWVYTPPVPGEPHP